ncbi:molybdenum cofactor synthesis related protein [Cyclospora cayetanensis]|uniref:Molybdenum cofactor synthesis related protein n=1 Tax=Cyclospora cayetanensis TaxID=88456 RepID=A0A1D3D2J7_9EIME|nr:molybdenum cofactor synthesis related protein [Cyclospora cayetanensis]
MSSSWVCCCRQVFFKEADVGNSKSLVLARACRALDSQQELKQLVHKKLEAFVNCEVAGSLVQKHDIVIDATDNREARYLLSDACVLAKRPLVCGSAIKKEGQVAVYNWRGGPCYRCLFPPQVGSAGESIGGAPTTKDEGACDTHGVLGPVPGLIGLMQVRAAAAAAVACSHEGKGAAVREQNTRKKAALTLLTATRCCVLRAALRILQALAALDIAASPALEQGAGTDTGALHASRMYTYDGDDAQKPWRSFAIRGRQKTCIGKASTRDSVCASFLCWDVRRSVWQQSYDYCLKVPPSRRMQAHDFASRLALWERVWQLPPLSFAATLLRQAAAAAQAHMMVLIDVRPRTQFVVAHLPYSLSWPLDDLLSYVQWRQQLTAEAAAEALGTAGAPGASPGVCAAFGPGAAVEGERKRRARIDSEETARLFEELSGLKQAETRAPFSSLSFVFICRRGRDSAIATEAVHGLLVGTKDPPEGHPPSTSPFKISDRVNALNLHGGLEALVKEGLIRMPIFVYVDGDDTPHALQQPVNGAPWEPSIVQKSMSIDIGGEGRRGDQKGRGYRQRQITLHPRRIQDVGTVNETTGP